MSNLRKRILYGGMFGISLASVAFTAAAPAEHALSNWPEWRGPLHNGVSTLANPPLEWSETNHIRWKIKVQGFGTSTPIIWDDRVFLLSAIATGKKVESPASEETVAQSASSSQDGGKRPARMTPKPAGEFYQFQVFCFERASGKMLWQKTARESAPHEGHHPDHGYASASPVTDGQLLWAYFGSRGLHCFDMQGNLKWSRDFGVMRTRNSFGEGSSPAVHGNTIVLYQDDETENDFVVGLNKETGEQLWQTQRDEATGWSTPLIIEAAGKAQVIVNATKKVRSYDLGTGKEIWSCGGQTANSIPTPVADADTVYVTSGYSGNALYAISLGRTGDLTRTDAIRWSRNKYTPYVPSPLLVDGLIYVLSGNNGVLSCFDAKTGSPHFEAARLEGLSGVYASPVSAKGRIYVLGRDGTCLVLKQGSRVDVLARNKLEDKTDASIALAGTDLFIRGHQWLYCISEAN